MIMRKLLLLVCLVALFFPFILKAQNQLPEAYFKNLVSKNATQIGLTNYDLQNTRISDFYYDNHSKTYMVYLIQTYKGVDVDNVLSPLCFKNEKLVSGHFIFVGDINKKAKNISEKPSVDAPTAVYNAGRNIGVYSNFRLVPSSLLNNGKKAEFNLPDISHNKIITELKWKFNESSATYSLVWNTIIHQKNNALWLISVDASTGAVVDKKNLTVYEKMPQQKQHHNIYVYEDDAAVAADNLNDIKGIKTVSSAKYRVVNFPAESPIVAGGTPALTTNPWMMFPNANAYTLKWNSDNTGDYDSAFGNNVHVVEDKDDNNVGGYSAHSITPLPNLDFDYTTTSILPTDSGSNREAGLTNLFYWNNLMHDMSYQYGFDEAAGNFQQTNFGRGGQENDYVNADGDDGSGIDNSNFSTPADGSSPRMQIYFWLPNPDTVLKVNAPATYAGFHPSSLGEISLYAQKPPVTSNIVFYNDSGATTHKGCVSPSNASDLAGKIVYVDRGSCNFDVKILNAQNAGAAGVIVGDTLSTAASKLVTMTYKTNLFGDVIFDNTVKIPASFVRTVDALEIKNLINAGTAVNVTLYSKLTDGSFDDGIVCHEYTHGISTRLTGGPSNSSCLTNAEAMNEGWSDYFAIMMTKDWSTAKLTDGALPKTIGNYAVSLPADGPGIRTFPYSTNFSINPQTYDSLITSDGETHDVGEVWCEMLWEMTWQLIQNIGAINPQLANAAGTGGNSVALNLVMEGLKLQLCKPGFVDGRNAILKADTVLYNGKYSAAIWKAFARRGLGFSASEGSTNSTVDGKAAYDLPSVLPVIFGSFTAQKQGASALLNWTTAQELNTDKFIVERSARCKNIFCNWPAKSR